MQYLHKLRRNTNS